MTNNKRIISEMYTNEISMITVDSEVESLMMILLQLLNSGWFPILAKRVFDTTVITCFAEFHSKFSQISQ